MILTYALTVLCFLLIMINSFTLRRMIIIRSFSLGLCIDENLQQSTKHNILRSLSSRALSPEMALASALAMVTQLAEERARGEPLDSGSKALELQNLLDAYG